jgi:hypothetical protein
MNFYTLPVEGFDMILGIQWLKSMGLIVWDFAALSMAFVCEGRSVHFVGCGGLLSTLYSMQPTDNIMETLLHTYLDIFEEPWGLPAQWSHDHRNHLLLGTAPVAVRPYRYPQLLKDEVERQCSDMLAQGIIWPSTFPFSSPVLLVKKVDGSWQFCVDYQALNDKTIKDKFPIPSQLLMNYSMNSRVLDCLQRLISVVGTIKFACIRMISRKRLFETIKGILSSQQFSLD